MRNDYKIRPKFDKGGSIKKKSPIVTVKKGEDKVQDAILKFSEKFTKAINKIGLKDVATRIKKGGKK
mgnify:CR=1 FL=1